MADRKPKYVTILFDVLTNANISLTEYCLAAVIDRLSYNAGNKMNWCFASREYLASTLNVTKGTILNNLASLQKKGLIELNDRKHVKTTKLWYELVTSDENLPVLPVQKLTGQDSAAVQKLTGEQDKTGQNLYLDGTKIVPYNNTYNSNTNTNTNREEILKEMKTKFFNLLQTFKKENPTKYPAKLYEIFFTYWAEPTNVNSKKISIRYEDEKYFDISKRLATFWRNTTLENRKMYWELDKPKN